MQLDALSTLTGRKHTLWAGKPLYLIPVEQHGDSVRSGCRAAALEPPEAHGKHLSILWYSLLHTKRADWRGLRVWPHTPATCSPPPHKTATNTAQHLHLIQETPREESTAGRPQSCRICPVWALPYHTCTRLPFLSRWSLYICRQNRESCIHTNHILFSLYSSGQDFSKLLISDIWTSSFWKHEMTLGLIKPAWTDVII